MGAARDPDRDLTGARRRWLPSAHRGRLAGRLDDDSVMSPVGHVRYSHASVSPARARPVARHLLDP